MTEILIKKYDNRRLYNTDEKKYISLADVRELVLKGIQFKVVEQKTGKDITSQILFQVIFETENDKLSSFPQFFLRFLITSPSSIIKDYFGTFFNSQVKMYMNNREKYLDILKATSTKMFGNDNPWINNPLSALFDPFSMNSKPVDNNDNNKPDDEKQSFIEEPENKTDDSNSEDIKELHKMMELISKRLANIEKKQK